MSYCKLIKICAGIGCDQRRVQLFRSTQVYRCLLTVGFSLFLVPSLRAADKPFKASDLPPAPSAAEQTAADKLVKDVYKAEFAKTAPADKAALAKKLVDEGKQTTSDMTSKFVLLRDARDLATDANDVDVAMSAVNVLAESFNIDAVEMKLTSLNRCGKSTSATVGTGIATAIEGLIESIIASDQFSAIGKVAALAESPAIHASPAQATAVRARIAEARGVAAQFDKSKAALEKLKADPANPEANLAAGRYLCFLKGDWNTGLPLLSKGSDAAIKKQALADLAIPPDLDGFKKLADVWWLLADSQEPGSRKQIRLHAAEWYEKAVDSLDGLAKTIAQKRITEVHRSVALAGRATNLITLIDPKQDSLMGDWSIDKGALICSSADFAPKVQIPFIPADEYDLRVEWSQPRIRHSLFITLVKDNTQFALVIDPLKGQLTGLDVVAGLPRTDPANPTVFRMKADLAANAKHSAIVQVRNDQIKASIDGQPVLSWKGDYKSLSVGMWYQLRSKTQLGIGCDDPTTFTVIDVTDITGAGKQTEHFHQMDGQPRPFP